LKFKDELGPVLLAGVGAVAKAEGFARSGTAYSRTHGSIKQVIHYQKFSEGFCVRVGLIFLDLGKARRDVGIQLSGKVVADYAWYIESMARDPNKKGRGFCEERYFWWVGKTPAETIAALVNGALEPSYGKLKRLDSTSAALQEFVIEETHYISLRARLLYSQREDLAALQSLQRVEAIFKKPLPQMIDDYQMPRLLPLLNK
jgi:hypothetical protein